MERIRQFQSPLARARGLGSAKEGVEHWWAQRVTGVALVPLTLWFVYSILAFAGADHASVVAFLTRPINAVLLILTAIAGFYHAALGLQVVYEDYIGHEGARVAAILLTKYAAIALAAVTIFATLKIAFGVA